MRLSHCGTEPQRFYWGAGIIQLPWMSGALAVYLQKWLVVDCISVNFLSFIVYIHLWQHNIHTQLSCHAPVLLLSWYMYGEI